VGETPSALCCCYPWAGGASALLAFPEINILIQNESRIECLFQMDCVIHINLTR
jgi:hypothetical protein